MTGDAPQGPALTPRLSGDDGDETLRREATLVDLVDRLLDKGVVLTGDITLSVADVDLVYVGLRVLLSSVEAAERRQVEANEGQAPPPPPPPAAGTYG
jgi:hypothetical protein